MSSRCRESVSDVRVGGVADDTDLSESEALSAAQVASPASAPSETEEESRDGTYTQQCASITTE